MPSASRTDGVLAAAWEPVSECCIQRDRSPSWLQLTSVEVAGWEGRGGQVAAANMLTTYAGQLVSPEEVAAAWEGHTMAPTPTTLLKTVHRLARVTGYERTFWLTYTNCLDTVRPTAPLACLLQWDAKRLHWVTAVDANQSWVRFNHWGKSQSMRREEFERRWGLNAIFAGSQPNRWGSWLHAHTAIRSA